MTWDEVLEEAIKAIAGEVNRCGCTGAIQALRSKPPEKSPEVEAPKDTGTAFGEIYEALDTVKAALAAGRAAEDRLLERRREVDALRLQVGELKLALEAAQAALAFSGQERRTDRMLLGKRENVSAQLESLRRELTQFDCRRTGGPVSDSGGKHCSQGAPCLACRLERAERDRDLATAASERILRDLETTKAEVARFKWEASDAPMLGEHSGHPSTCPACRDGYPPPPGEPAPR